MTRKAPSRAIEELRSQETRVLVIGYGNEIRRDDAIGPQVAAAVAQWNLPGVRTLICQQLTPELADPIASAGHVIFVDATIESTSSVQLLEIEPQETFQPITHAADPRALLSLAQKTFGRCPPACSLSIPVQDLEFGDELSPLAREGLRVALTTLRHFINRALLAPTIGTNASSPMTAGSRLPRSLPRSGRKTKLLYVPRHTRKTHQHLR